MNEIQLSIKNMKQTKYLFIVVVFLLLSSCNKNTKKIEINCLEIVPEVHVLKDFQIVKINRTTYDIQLTQSIKGELFFSDTSIFLKLPMFGEKVLLFSKNNDITKPKCDTIFTNGSDRNDRIIIKRHPNLLYEDICKAEIDIFYGKNNFYIVSYSLWYSFEKGFLQIGARDDVTLEVLKLQPEIEFRSIHISDGYYL